MYRRLRHADFIFPTPASYRIIIPHTLPRQIRSHQNYRGHRQQEHVLILPAQNLVPSAVACCHPNQITEGIPEAKWQSAYFHGRENHAPDVPPPPPFTMRAGSALKSLNNRKPSRRNIHVHMAICCSTRMVIVVRMPFSFEQARHVMFVRYYYTRY